MSEELTRSRSSQAQAYRLSPSTQRAPRSGRARRSSRGSCCAVQRANDALRTVGVRAVEFNRHRLSVAPTAPLQRETACRTDWWHAHAETRQRNEQWTGQCPFCGKGMASVEHIDLSIIKHFGVECLDSDCEAEGISVHLLRQRRGRSAHLEHASRRRRPESAENEVVSRAKWAKRVPWKAIKAVLSTTPNGVAICAVQRYGARPRPLINPSSGRKGVRRMSTQQPIDANTPLRQDFRRRIDRGAGLTAQRHRHRGGRLHHTHGVSKYITHLDCSA